MSNDYWKGVLETARKRLEELRARRDVLDAEREEVNLEIVQVEQVVENLAPLVAEPSLEQSGLRINVNLQGVNLSDACRIVLQKADKYMTPIEVRNALEANRYELSQHNNALASIHGVLKRMADSGEVETLPHDARGTLYSWKSTGTRVPGSTGGGGAWSQFRPNVIEDEQKDLGKERNTAMNRLIREAAKKKRGVAFTTEELAEEILKEKRKK